MERRSPVSEVSVLDARQNRVFLFLRGCLGCKYGCFYLNCAIAITSFFLMVTAG